MIEILKILIFTYLRYGEVIQLIWDVTDILKYLTSLKSFLSIVLDACVQIELKSIIDLIKLYFILDKLNLSKNNSRKCMIELRENATGTYKGLIYCLQH